MFSCLDIQFLVLLWHLMLFIPSSSRVLIIILEFIREDSPYPLLSLPFPGLVTLVGLLPFSERLKRVACLLVLSTHDWMEEREKVEESCCTVWLSEICFLDRTSAGWASWKVSGLAENEGKIFRFFTTSSGGKHFQIFTKSLKADIQIFTKSSKELLYTDYFFFFSKLLATWYRP